MSQSPETAQVPDQTRRIVSLEKIWPLMLGIALPIFSGAAYLTGITYHQTYLNAFRIPLNLLTKTTADYFLYAYMAVTEAGLKLLGVSGLIMMVAIMLGAYLWQIFSWIDRKVMQSGHRQWVRSKVQSKPLLRFLGKAMMVPSIVLALGYIGLLFFMLFLAPMMFGHTAGAQRADDDIAIFERGCEKVRRGGPDCNEIFEDGNPVPVARGFIIDSSEKYIAIYDGGTVRTLPVEGKSFVASVSRRPD